LENAAKHYAAKKSSETSPGRASRLRKNRNNQNIKHNFESPGSQNHRRQDIIKQKSWTTANETVDQRIDRDMYVFAETICEVCSKRCNPNQFAKLNLSNCGFSNYLLQECAVPSLQNTLKQQKANVSIKSILE
jgi:hypothetical protein